MKQKEEGDCWYGWEGPGCMMWVVVIGLAVETVVWEARMRLREMDEKLTTDVKRISGWFRRRE